MSATAPSITIQCAKPDCHWSGAPGDAPGHTCPTPAAEADLPHPFAGMIAQDGKPIADETADRGLPFWVVWDDGQGETRILGTKATEAEAVTFAQEMTAEGIKLGEVTVKPNPAAALAAEDVAGAEPTTRKELETWLLEFGDYDDGGVPLDEKTATYDARLSALVENAGTEPEPELDEISDTVDGEPVPEPPLDEEPQIGEATDEPREEVAGDTLVETVTATAAEWAEASAMPWELQIAASLEEQTGIKDYRWLLISKAENGTAELVGRGRIKKDAEELLIATESAGQLPGLEIVKTSDVLEAAERLKIEPRRELVEPDAPEPGQETQEPQEEPERVEPEPQAAPAAPAQESDESAAVAVLGMDDAPEGLKAAAADRLAAAPEPKEGLFDADAYKAPELAISPIDGKTIDRIAIDFSGGIMLDRSKAADVALHNRISTAQRVELWVEGTWAGTAAKPATNKEGELDVIVSRKALRVTGLRIIDPEDLKTIEAEMAFATVVRRAIAAGKTHAQLFDALEQIEQNDGASDA